MESSVYLQLLFLMEGGRRAEAWRAVSVPSPPNLLIAYFHEPP